MAGRADGSGNDTVALVLIWGISTASDAVTT
jgi:hypothetical protein